MGNLREWGMKESETDGEGKEEKQKQEEGNRDIPSPTRKRGWRTDLR